MQQPNYTRALACMALGWAAACNALPPSAVDGSGSGSGSTATPAGNANTAVQNTDPTGDTNTPTPTDTNTVTAPVCPTPANATDYFGQPRCCNTKAAFCDDFESASVGGNPNATWWSVIKANGDTLAISTDQAARGKQALHIHAPSNSHSMITTKVGFPFANNSFWGRAFVYWNTAAHPSNHTTYMAAGPANTSVDGSNGTYEWLRYSSFGNGNLGGNDSDPDNSSFSNTSLPTGKWTCLEWHYDPANRLAHYFVDGAEISTFNIDAKHDNDGTMNFAQVELGWELYSADSAVPSTGWDMYLDEIALDAKQIGCQN